METTTTTEAASQIWLLSVGRGYKLHIEKRPNTRTTLCGTGNFHGMHTLGNQGTFPRPRLAPARRSFSSAAAAAQWLSDNGPINSCGACIAKAGA